MPPKPLPTLATLELPGTMTVPSPPPTAPPPAVPTACGGAPPPAGTNLDPAKGTGLGRLKIENGTSSPAQVKLVASGSGGLVRHVLVGAQSTWSGVGIPAGTYRVLYAQGRGWDAARRTFSCERVAQQFEEPLAFRQSGRSYDVWTLTLHPVVGGTARTDEIAGGAFDQAGA